MADDLNKYCKGKKLVDIGCADGSIKKLLQCSTYIGVDPFSTTDDVVKVDGLEYM